MMQRSVEFFERQFRRQVESGEFELNPFERAALGYLAGDVLDLGCGLGNLAIEAARRGCRVTAVDASATAIARLRRAACAGKLDLHAVEADVTVYGIDREYDTIVAIGLLMFFRESRALELLDELRLHVRPGGCAVVNVLVEGTTYMEMFTPGDFHLFRPGELEQRFSGWEIELSREDRFPAPGETSKVFSTVIARRPCRMP